MSDSSNNNFCSPDLINTNLDNANASNINVKVSKDLAAAAGFNVETPIVNAIIGNITGVLPTKRNDLNDWVKCELCDCEISSKINLADHLNGSRHKKKLTALNIISQLKNKKGIDVDDCDSPKSFQCDICALTVNSAQQLEFHLLGSKHKKNLGKTKSYEAKVRITSKNLDDNDSILSLKRKKLNKLKNCSFTCPVCKIELNSQIQFMQHLTTVKHRLNSSKVKTSGKPMTLTSAIENNLFYSCHYSKELQTLKCFGSYIIKKSDENWYQWLEKRKMKKKVENVIS